MVDSGALFSHGFYRPRLAPRKSDHHYLWVGRVSGLAAVLIALFYALFLIQRVLYSFLLTETMAAYMGISLVGELVWKRANRWGAASSVFISLGTNFSLYHWKHQRLDYWDPSIFFFSLAAGVVALVVVSLLTAPEAECCVGPFFTKLQTPSDYLPAAAAAPNGPATEHEEDGDWSRGLAPETSRWVAEHGRQLLLINLLHPLRGACGVGFFRAYRDDLQGLLVGWLLCAGLVFGLWAFLHF
jgi:Na+/proline symporter